MLRAWHAACFEIGVADGETFLELESLIALAESNGLSVAACRRELRGSSFSKVNRKI